jgi:hypothetical protein
MLSVPFALVGVQTRAIRMILLIGIRATRQGGNAGPLLWCFMIFLAAI